MVPGPACSQTAESMGTAKWAKAKMMLKLSEMTSLNNLPFGSLGRSQKDAVCLGLAAANTRGVRAFTPQLAL